MSFMLAFCYFHIQYDSWWITDLTQQFLLLKAILIAFNPRSEQKKEWEKDIRPKNYFIPSFNSLPIKMSIFRFQISNLQLSVYSACTAYCMLKFLVYGIKSKEFGIAFPFLASHFQFTFHLIRFNFASPKVAKFFNSSLDYPP